MNQNCQNCKHSFEITDDDQKFYDKMKVPAPTFCPECRLIRRMAFSNERMLYRKKCDLCGKNVISMYHEDSVFPVYCIDCYRSDKWDVMKYAKDYDFSKPFFEQFAHLKIEVPRVALFQQGTHVNSDYVNRAANNKNCYLVFRASNNENCLHSHHIFNSNDSMDCFNIQQNELSYESVDCVNCYNIKYSQECKNCNNSCFMYDCRNCSDCFCCAGLRNKSYSIFNKSYSKEEYFKKLKEFSMDSFLSIQGLKHEFKKFIVKFIRSYMMSTHSDDVSGNWIDECKNVSDSYICSRVENGKYLFGVTEAKDSMDYFYFGLGSELMYETSNCGHTCSNLLFTNETHANCSDLQYCDNCISSSNLFGCIGLKNKQYCIFNKQYAKEEYEKLLPKIVNHMNAMPYTDKEGRVYKYGEFFPIKLSSFSYNETVANEYFPLTEQQINDHGYGYVDIEKYKGSYKPTIQFRDLPDRSGNINDNILREIIECGSDQCRGVGAFKIIKQELEFYRKQNLPLPRLCPDCRHYERIKQRNPLKLWKRKCQCSGIKSDNQVYRNTINHSHHGADHCPNEFETTYAPECSEIVYCGACYLQEVV